MFLIRVGWATWSSCLKSISPLCWCIHRSRPESRFDHIHLIQPIQFVVARTRRRFPYSPESPESSPESSIVTPRSLSCNRADLTRLASETLMFTSPSVLIGVICRFTDQKTQIFVDAVQSLMGLQFSHCYSSNRNQGPNLQDIQATINQEINFNLL